MTLTEVRNSILARFEQADMLSIEDLADVEMPAVLAERRNDILRTALDELCEVGIARKVTGAPETWILVTPIGAAGQQIPISLSTAISVADEINAYIDAMDEDWPHADTLAIDEANILMLLAIITDLRGDHEDLGEMDES